MNELTSKKLETMPTLAISMVCSRWRDLTKAYPILWSRLRIIIPDISPNHPRFRLLSHYLVFSQQSLLTIQLEGGVQGDLQSHHLGVCADINAQADCWHVLSIWEPKVYIALKLNSMERQHFPVLETLVFPNLIFDDPAGLNPFQNAPNLHELSLASLSLANLGERSRFPFNQLTTFSINRHPAEMGNLLKISDKMRKLHIREVLPGDSAYYEHCTPPVAAPALKTLSLSLSFFPNQNSLAEVAFASLTCPSLSSLFIEARNEYNWPWPRQDILGFVSRSSFLLATLSIQFIPLSDLDLIDLLQSLPSLLHFIINDFKPPLSIASTSPGDQESPITSRLVQSLHAFPQMNSVTISSAMVPRLESLSLTFSSSGTFCDRSLVDMISSRWFPAAYADGYGVNTSKSLESEGGTVCLRSVVLRFPNREVDEEIYGSLTHLEEAGMRVVVTGKSSES
ncbi:hypothetical protein BT96DRAFT_1007876 [Gymnopus androsaceus JB14]|uniref:F-box domain-containing protein n=1 Tax=Gymnopus androsaceus JB14 TaxID=1447944 RepID=A0A6A4GGY4_9AGAR|nr:hypothetical protein BT96DRAFT_1007876 [Gymnopus androsaceus JB14]